MMVNLLPSPNHFDNLKRAIVAYFASKKGDYAVLALLDLALILIILFNGLSSAQRMIDPLVSPFKQLTPIVEAKVSSKEVFGFAPYWNIDKLDNVDFNTLTTLAYFGVEINPNGNLEKNDPGYRTFTSQKATSIFKKARAHGTKVILTLTLMKNGNIRSLMDDPQAQERTINQAVDLVKSRGIDGLNVDIEYTGNPGENYRQKFTQFVTNITNKMHKEVPGSYVTVSVYASAVKEPKIYDIAAISQVSDGIFMMAYDFAVASSENAIPTAPLYGHKNGKYWYDIATAVDDFLLVMPAEKLILGVPYYGYNYLVYQPNVKAETRPYYSWRGKATSQTYSLVSEKFQSENIEGVDQVIRGWDEDGQVGYVAYRVVATDTWRMVFMENTKSLGLKYDFVKEKKLKGVGIWALGNDHGRDELWQLLAEKFGAKSLAQNTLSREVRDIE